MLVIADTLRRDALGCYGGPAGTQGVGACVPGSQGCSGGAWGACSGQVLPAGGEDGLQLHQLALGRVNQRRTELRGTHGTIVAQRSA